MRLKRSKLATIVASLLGLIVCGVWVESYWWSDLIGVNTSPRGANAVDFTNDNPLAGASSNNPLAGAPTGTFVGVGIHGGGFYIVRFLVFDDQSCPTGWSRGRIESPDESIFAMAERPTFAGFSFHWHGSDNALGLIIGVPIWMVPVFCAFPLLLAKRLLHRKALPKS